MGKKYDELAAEYKRLAKKADQRLVRLEKYADDPLYRNVLRWAYSTAMHDLKGWDMGEINRFNKKPPANYQELLGRVNDVKRFLESETSTLKGIKVHYKKQADTINKIYGTQFTWESFAKYFQSGLANKLDTYGYETAFKAIAKIQERQNRIKDDIDKADKSHKVVEDKQLNEAVEDMLDQYGNEIKDIILKK